MVGGEESEDQGNTVGVSWFGDVSQVVVSSRLQQLWQACVDRRWEHVSGGRRVQVAGPIGSTACPTWWPAHFIGTCISVSISASGTSRGSLRYISLMGPVILLWFWQIQAKSFS